LWDGAYTPDDIAPTVFTLWTSEFQSTLFYEDLNSSVLNRVILSNEESFIEFTTRLLLGVSK